MTPALGSRLRHFIPGVELCHMCFRHHLSIFLLSSARLHNISCTGAITANWPTVLIEKVPRSSMHDDEIRLYVGFSPSLLGPHLRRGSYRQ